VVIMPCACVERGHKGVHGQVGRREASRQAGATDMPRSRTECTPKASPTARAARPLTPRHRAVPMARALPAWRTGEKGPVVALGWVGWGGEGGRWMRDGVLEPGWQH
jgi:hypothetical protein